MSQRECAGFNWPGFAVAAGEPVGGVPEAASWAWRDSDVRETPNSAPPLFAFSFLARNCSGVPPASLAAGVAQGDASLATSFRGLELSPCLFDADDFQSRADAVGHPGGVAEWAATQRSLFQPLLSASAPARVLTDFSPSDSRGLGQFARRAAPGNFRQIFVLSPPP